MAVLVMLSAALLLGLLLPSSVADNVLYPGDELRTDESLTDGNNKFIMRSDCNLVLYHNGQEVWSSNMTLIGNYDCVACLKTDGNLAIFNFYGNLVWESYTNGPEGKYMLVLQRDGHVVIYGSPVWTIPNDEPTNRNIAMVTKK